MVEVPGYGIRVVPYPHTRGGPGVRDRALGVYREMGLRQNDTESRTLSHFGVDPAFDKI